MSSTGCPAKLYWIVRNNVRPCIVFVSRWVLVWAHVFGSLGMLGGIEERGGAVVAGDAGGGGSGSRGKGAAAVEVWCRAVLVSWVGVAVAVAP